MHSDARREQSRGLGAYRAMKILAMALLAAWPAITSAQERCDTPARERATEAIRVLGREIAAAPAHADPAPLRAQFQALGALACLESLGEGGAPPFASVLGVRAWWQRGGADWLYELPGQSVVFPPEELPALTRESAPEDDPLRSLLCPAGDVECGRSTAGYRLRAEAAFLAHNERENARAQADLARRRAECLPAAMRAPADERYPRWRSCVGSTLPREWVLPLGEFRAPAEGWLVVRGRRGHYQFCDRVTAFDLATGAYYTAASCSGLALRNNGSVDQSRTDAQRNGEAIAGQVPVEHLREAAWMILFMERATQLRSTVHTEDLPPGLERRMSDRLFGSGVGSAWATSAQTQLSWTWVVGRDTRAQGTLTWPDSYRAGEDHAARLLEIAEAGLVAGCTRAQLPRGLPIDADGGGVSAIDADPNARRAVELTLAERLRAIRAPRCR
jgi:hypothetical protein